MRKIRRILIVLKIFTPLRTIKNQPLYPPKESSIKELSEGSHWLSGSLYLVLLFSKFSPPYEASKNTPFIPQRSVPLRNDPWGPIGWVALFTLFYSPKERFLKEPLRGVPFVRVLSFLYLIPQRRVPENSLSGSHWFEWLSLPCLIPQRRVPKNSLSGSHWFEWLSSPCLINLKFDSPPTTHSKSTSLSDGWVGVFTFFKICWENLRDFFFFFFKCV